MVNINESMSQGWVGGLLAFYTRGIHDISVLTNITDDVDIFYKSPKKWTIAIEKISKRW